jgi:DNA-directed RNA polymerase specialized sigma24 family protein
MGEVADLRPMWKAPDEAMATEPVAFDWFFEEQKERLLRMLSVIIGSRAEAEDLAQEAFTRVFERWETVAAMEDPAGYRHRTAMNLFRNQYRQARVRLARTVGLGPSRTSSSPWRIGTPRPGPSARSRPGSAPPRC